MKLSATEAKREFGSMVLKAQSEPVRILRNGKPVVAVISNEDYELFEILKANQLKHALTHPGDGAGSATIAGSTWRE